MRVTPFRSSLGARPTAAGTTVFRVYSASAQRVELCLVDATPGRRSVTERRVEMRRDPDDPDVWCTSALVGAGARYGYRVHGAFDARRGMRSNPSKLLLDPYGRCVDEPPAFTPEVHDLLRDSDSHGSPDPRDSLVVAPWSVVSADRPSVPTTRPALPRGGRVIYEAHLAQLTNRLPDVDDGVRGTFAALRSPHLIEHLHSIGVSTLELLPVMHSASEPQLIARGRRNVWGYNPLGFFSPAPWLCSSEDIDAQWDEIAQTVAHLHAAGLELVLDVVYNHTAEGPVDGPTYHLRGLDNAGYYRTDASTGDYLDASGCGNTLDAAQRPVQDLIVESLRHWVLMTDVDGFRFDLAPTLGRAPGFSSDHPLLHRIGADDVLGDRVLIAEPWDLGPDGHHTGDFTGPTNGDGWLEWNDGYRSSIRDFWRPGPGGLRSRLVTALAGSSEVFAPRRATASIGYVTAHDGFTLRDLVSYNHKHNLDNGENNRDGTDDNQSYNGGAEGDTTDPAIIDARLRRQASMLGCLMLQIGTPMINAGDELNRTQRGNNNAYCLSDPDLDMDWEPTDTTRRLSAVMQALAAVRRAHGELFDGRWLTSPQHPGRGHVVRWLTRDGQPIDDDQWTADPRVLIACFPATSTRGPLLVAANGNEHPVAIIVPDAGSGAWRVAVDTSQGLAAGEVVSAGTPLLLDSFSLVVLGD